jgi:chitinase
LLQQDTSASFTAPIVVAQGNIRSRSFSGQATGTYYYRLKASNAAGTSGFSHVQFVMVAAPIALNTPVLHDILNQSLNYIVSWDKVTNATSYTLQESRSVNFADPMTVVSGINNSVSISGKSTGTYFYRVIAHANNAMSAPSNVESIVIVKALPDFALVTPFVESYWESWNSTDSIATIASMKFDVVNISFANFISTGNHTFQVSGIDVNDAIVHQFIAAVHNAGKKVKISIGGATYPLAPQLQTIDDAIGMAHALATYVASYNLDGVDLDIEDRPAAANQIALIQNLRQLLGTQALISYTPQTPTNSTVPYFEVIKGAHSYLTSISFMAYNYGPGYTYQQDINAFLSWGVPSTKIVIGLMPGSDDIGIQTSLANVTATANNAAQNKLGGVMFWSLNRDHQNQTGLGVDAATDTAWKIFHP